MKGLTKEEVLEQIKRGKTNEVKTSADKSKTEIIAKNIFTYFNLIFTVLTILVLISGKIKGLMFLPVVIINLMIGIIQQLKSKKILDELALLEENNYTCYRNGKEEKIQSSKLVLNDIIKLKSGEQIPADAIVLEGFLSVNESLLTGEIDEIDKVKDSELRSGSFVVSGEAVAKLTAVGEDSYASKLTKEAKQIKEKESEMVRDIEKIIKIAGFIIIPVGALLLYQSMFINKLSYSDAISSMVGAITGMIPEGLYLLVTIALAISASRLAKLKVLLHDMKSIESLARIDVLCVDKTGTITSNIMKVTDIDLSLNNEEKEKSIKDLINYINTVKDNNDTIDAIRKYFKKEKIMIH